MRIGSSQVINAFLAGKPRKIKNDQTDGQTLWFHGNRIAWRDGDEINMTLCGWNTVTTRLRLNEMCHQLMGGWAFHSKKREPHLAGHEIDAHDVFTWRPGTIDAEHMLACSILTK